MAAGEHEAVAPEPLVVGRVVPHDLLEEQVRQWGQAHRGAGVAVARLLHGVGGEQPHGVDGPDVERPPARRFRDRQGELRVTGAVRAAARGVGGIRGVGSVGGIAGCHQVLLVGGAVSGERRACGPRLRDARPLGRVPRNDGSKPAMAYAARQKEQITPAGQRVEDLREEGTCGARPEGAGRRS